MAKQRVTEKMRAALTTIAFLLVWLILGSSVSILSPKAENLGVLFGLAFSLAIILCPIYYVKIRNIKVKKPKPLFVEPPAWKAILLSFTTSVLIFFLYIIALTIPPFNFISDELTKDTFLGKSAIMIILFTSLFGPITIFFVYTHTHYKRIVEYNSAEWKKLKAKS